MFFRMLESWCAVISIYIGSFQRPLSNSIHEWVEVLEFILDQKDFVIEN